MTENTYKQIWTHEENIAHIKGWDFSHIHGRYEEENDLPWDYENIVRQYLKDDLKVMDYDTGGAEFLFSLGHPHENTAATEGFGPNVQLCKELLLPLGVDFRECADPARIPFEDESFDLMINRHGAFSPPEAYRLLKPGGAFVTEQVGSKNDRDLVEMVLPDSPIPFPHLNLDEQKEAFEAAGFRVLSTQEAFRPIRFFDVGAFVWFAHVIEWEFPGFSVDKCFDQLLQMQSRVDKAGMIEGTIHRFLIVAQKAVE